MIKLNNKSVATLVEYEETRKSHIFYIDGKKVVIPKSSGGTSTSSSSGVGEKGDKGDKGDTGNGIVSVTKTSTNGLVDTYTITFTNGSTTTFDVTNGSGSNGTSGSGSSSSSSGSSAGSQDVSVPNFIKCIGNKFYDVYGNEYRIKGMNFDNWAWFNPSVPMEWYCNESTYLELSNMGINTVRWYLNYALIEDNDNPLTYKQSGWNWLDQNLAWAEKYGIKIIINMHVPPSMPTDDWDDSRIETLQLWVGDDATSNMNRLKALWQAIATRYKDNPTVLGYGLLNEPRVPYINNSVSDSEAQWETLAGQLKTLIRAIDTNHVLFVEPTTKVHDMDNDEDLVTNYREAMFTLNDDNYSMEVHLYEPMELTHQASNGYPIGEFTYPKTDVISLVTNEWVDSTEYSDTNDATTYNFSSRTYQTVESNTYMVASNSTINIGYAMLNCYNIGNGNTVYWDNLKIAQYDTNGTFVKYVKEYNFNTQDDFVISSVYWNNNVNWSSTGGVDNSGCLITTDNGDDYMISQNGDYKYFAIEKGYKYRAIATIKIIGSNTSTILPQIAFCHTDSVHGVDKDYLREIMLSYKTIANNNNVPLYIGEFGSFVDSFPYGGRTWTADMLDLMNEYGISGSYHQYKPGLYSSYYSSVVDSDNVRVTEGTDVRDGLLYNIFKERWGNSETTLTGDSLTRTINGEDVLSYKTSKVKSMALSSSTSQSICVVGRNMASIKQIEGTSTTVVNNVTSYTMDGLTISVENDGQVTINGTSTNRVRIRYNKPKGVYLVGKTMQVGWGVSSGTAPSGLKLSTNLYYRSGYTHNFTSSSFGLNDGQIVKADTYDTMYIEIPSGTTFSSVTFWVRLEMLTTENSSYLDSYQQAKFIRYENVTSSVSVDNISNFDDIITIIPETGSYILDITTNESAFEVLNNEVADIKVSIQSLDKLAGKTICCCGTSLMQGNNTGTNWCTVLAETYKNTLFVNKAVGGSSFNTHSSGSSFEIGNQIVTIGDLTSVPDIILVEGGMNDYLTQKTVGTVTAHDYSSTFDRSSMASGIEEIIKYCLTNYPTAKLLFMTCHYYHNATNFPIPMSQYVDVMIEACNKWSIPCLDLYRYGGLNPKAPNAGTWFNGDGIHYIEAGYRRTAPIIANFLEQF